MTFWIFPVSRFCIVLDFCILDSIVLDSLVFSILDFFVLDFYVVPTNLSRHWDLILQYSDLSFQISADLPCLWHHWPS